VSLKAYHELTQLTEQLPRTYTLEHTQKSLNESYCINATPGRDIGAQTPLLYELEKDSRLEKFEDSKVLVINLNLPTIKGLFLLILSNFLI